MKHDAYTNSNKGELDGHFHLFYYRPKFPFLAENQNSVLKMILVLLPTEVC